MMPKKKSEYPRFYMRMDADTREWLKDYADRQGKPMAQIIKACLAELKRKDLHAPSLCLHLDLSRVQQVEPDRDKRREIPDWRSGEVWNFSPATRTSGTAKIGWIVLSGESNRRWRIDDDPSVGRR